MEGTEAMTADALRAEIAATRHRQQAAEGRGQELDAEIRQAEERRRLRRELAEAREMLFEQEEDNRIKAIIRQGIDADRPGFCMGQACARAASRKLGGRHQASGGESTSFGHMVSRGEYVWELRQFSWLRSALRQKGLPFQYTGSQIFEVGGLEFQFIYHPEGGRVRGGRHGTLAIFTEEREKILLRYRMYVRAHGGDFVQWGETRDEVHEVGPDGLGLAYGPDVHLEGQSPDVKGIFGLTHEQLLQSEWVENDTLTVKFALEVRPGGWEESQPLHEAVSVPGPSMSDDTQALLQNGKGSDVRFLVHGEVIHAHSQVLCARSEVFGKVLTVGMQESITKEIVIEDCDIASFKAFLKFLYTDSLPSVEELSVQSSSATEDGNAECSQLLQLQALLAVSHKYQVAVSFSNWGSLLWVSSY